MAKGKSPAFQFYPDAWLSSTSVSLMSPAEEGAYIRLLCHAWQAEDCGLPDNDEELAELSRLRSQWKKSGPRIRAKFNAIGDRLFNDRLIEERQKQIEWSSKSSEAGKKSGLARNQKATKREPKTNGGSILVGGLVEPNYEPNINSSSSSSSSSSEETQTPLRANVTEFRQLSPPSLRFEDWWALWSAVRGTNRRPQAESAYFRRVTRDNENFAFACTQSYLDGLYDPRKGFNPDNFLDGQALDNFQAVWPKARDSPAGMVKTKQQQQADEWMNV